MSKVHVAGLLMLASLTMAGQPRLALADEPVAAAASASAPASAPAGKRLDLSAPPVNHVLSPAQISSLTAEQDDTALPEDISVESSRYQVPVPQGTFRALPWAIMHPLQAWRIFTPVTD